ncbi:hypothetical protein DL98DRAFT_520031 [Cadophora sp. DSE1049]|nr:hypothetical protein DL98DRAFT_520031 [Cadophora sp. DSE1049]
MPPDSNFPAHSLLKQLVQQVRRELNRPQSVPVLVKNLSQRDGEVLEKRSERRKK